MEQHNQHNSDFDFRGVNHLALVCSDMQRTVDFYSGVLGMPLVKTVELPRDLGQHFFFDCGGGNCLAFFWFPKAPEAAPGISAPVGRPDQGELLSAISSMNHVAFTVPKERFDEYHQKLQAKGVETSPILNHDDSPAGVTPELTDDVYVRSFYFTDPDGILLEFACWMRDLNADDVRHTPNTAADRTPPVPA